MPKVRFQTLGWICQLPLAGSTTVSSPIATIAQSHALFTGALNCFYFTLCVQVTDDMKTKNMQDRSGAVLAAPGKAAAPPAAKAGPPAKLSCEGGRKWVVEN